MKKSDVAMIILIASISVLIAYFVAKGIFGGTSNTSQIIKTIDPIDSKIVEPDSAIFNSNAINPSVEVQISGTSQPGAQ
jgi:ABC-type cobalt transport system substrate-binding protein